MDEDEVDEKFVSMAMNDYAASIEKFIEDTRITELKIRVAMNNDDHATATMLSANLFHAVSAVQVGSIPNLITSYAHALNDERSGGIEVFDLGHEVLVDLRRLHMHLVHISQPTEELSMVVDLMTKLGDGLDASVYGRMQFDASEE